MPKTSFVYFTQPYLLEGGEDYDGFLAFLPTNTDQVAHSPPYRSYKGERFCWFEFKNTALTNSLELDVKSEKNWFLLLGINSQIIPSLAIEYQNLQFLA